MRTVKCNIMARWAPVQISAAWFKNTFSLKTVRFKGPAQRQVIGVGQSLPVQSQMEVWCLEEESLAAAVC